MKRQTAFTGPGGTKHDQQRGWIQSYMGAYKS